MRQLVKTMRKARGAVRGLVYAVVLVAVLTSLMCLGALSKPVQAAADWLSASEFKLSAADGAQGDKFGQAVAISGDTLVVGAPTADVGANGDQGSVYVYVRSGTTWVPQQELHASDGVMGDRFGSAVAISGDTLVVGEPAYGRWTGSAFVFVRTGTSWIQQEKLLDSVATQGDYFGCSVAISGDTVVVGADAVHATYADQGAISVFTRSGTTWTQRGLVTVNDGAPYDNFGCSVAISGDTTVVGAGNHDVGAATEQGSAYVFNFSGPDWTPKAELTAIGG